MLMLTELPGIVTAFNLSYFSSLNTVIFILATCTVMRELRGMYATGYSIGNPLGSELQLIHFNGGNYRCWYLQHRGWGIQSI